MAFSWYGLLCSLIVINVLFETGVSGSSNRSNPLQADDILKQHTFGNHHQCQRLCWYIELCERFSFYTKNLDDAHPHNCVLHAGEEKDDDLLDGWMQEKASGDYLPSEHGCRNRTCGKENVCIPLAPDVKYDCIDLPADVDECASSPCQNGVNCVDGDRTYTCNCLPGYIGDHCETDIDECASNPCTSGQSCQDQVNGYTCCPPGYTGKNCTETWLKQTCDSSCPATNQTCHLKQCHCANGFFFSHSSSSCVTSQDCKFTGNDKYLHFKDMDWKFKNDNYINSTEQGNDTACARLCNEISFPVGPLGEYRLLSQKRKQKTKCSPGPTKNHLISLRC